MKYLLDTHVFLWTIANSKELSKNALAVIKNPDNVVYISSVTLWEIAIKSRIGKLKIEGTSIAELPGIIEKLKYSAVTKEISIQCFDKEKTILLADLNMVKTILRNLISNAVKFTFPGGIVSVYAEKGDLETLITVSDTGMGIEEELLKSIWDFTENRSTLGTSKEKGTGLGLLICKEFVEKMGGRIWVESIPNKGCEFVFALPNH